MEINREVLTVFITAAKRNTYASEVGSAFVQPLLEGSKQLEYRNGDYFYRDIYYGSSFFVGQEIVEFRNRPIWSMVYSGGVTIPNVNGDSMGQIYHFLRQALRLVDTNFIYRGPQYYELGEYVYQNECEGTIDCFHGKEMILLDAKKVYELKYSGGIIL